MFIRTFATVALLALVACDGGEDPTATDGETREETILALTGSDADGEAVYTTNCQSCHAADGTGGVGPNIQGENFDEIVPVVLNGKGSMQSFDNLTDQAIADVAAYAESL